MLIKTIREKLNAITDCIPVSRGFEIDGRTCVLAMLYKSEGAKYAIVAAHYGDDDAAGPGPLPENATNRMNVYLSLKTSGNDTLAQFRSFELWGRTYRITSANGTVCRYDSALIEYSAMLALMIGRGVDFGALEDYPPGQLRFYEYRLDDGCVFPEPGGVQPGTEAPFAVNIGKTAVSVPVGKRLTAAFNQEKTRKYIINNGRENESHEFFVDGLISYDIWAEAETRFDDEKFAERFSPEERARIKDDYLKQLPDICPQGMNLAVLEYESEDDIQLQFYTEKYLEQPVEHKSSSIFLIMMKPEKSTGPNGRKLRACVLEPVPKGLDGTLDIELVNYYKHFPEKRIVF